MKAMLSRARMSGRHFAMLLLVVAIPAITLAVMAALTPLPSALLSEQDPSLRVLDRHGRLIREVRSQDGELFASVRLSDVAPEAIAALVAAEDARFFRHPGVDPLAIARAFGQLLEQRRIVSGASTITQQLARTLVRRPRTLVGKIKEMALAIRLERSLSKDQILEQYLSRVAFGTAVRGIDAASRLYFDKPPSKLSLAEAAALISIPRGPSLYDPRRHPEALLARRNRVLERMRSRRLWPTDAIDRALAEPLVVRRGLVEGGAPHFVRAMAGGVLEPFIGTRAKTREVVATLDGDLQNEVETLVAQTAERMVSAGGTAASVIVVDNRTSEVLAYVGSPDFSSERALGQNDGVRALRQPGSALKPFIYAAGMEQLGLTGATLLPDIELHLPAAPGAYEPKNYDGRFHGPVRLRDALGSSLNVPAVHTASRLGAKRALDVLRRFGFESLDRDAAYYGPAIALGDGEVRLTELVAAYATLARGGVYQRLRFASTARREDGTRTPIGNESSRRVIDARVAALITDILSDRGARVAAFGTESALELPFAAAVKTGTSKGFRDNVTVGFTHEVTVAVWVGNFDGTPMVHSSGVTGAAPLFRAVLLAAERRREREPLVDRTGLVDVEVCPLSGQRAGSDCPHAIHERFVAGTEPAVSCSMHVRAFVDSNGALASPDCKSSSSRVFERYPPEFSNWAARSGRPLLPTNASTQCPPEPRSGEYFFDIAGVAEGRVVYPFEGARFLYDPAVASAQQGVVLRAAADTTAVTFFVDGQAVGRSRKPYAVPWLLTPGAHTVRIEADGRQSPLVHFSVQ